MHANPSRTNAADVGHLFIMTYTLRNRPRGLLPSLLWMAMPMAAAAALGSGCASYQFGTGLLYRPDIRTVHVPIFESDSLRRNLGERLTEAVAKEIELTTPYKVVNDVNADSILTGRIISDEKTVVAENGNDFPRDVKVGFVVQFSWRGRAGNLIRQSSGIPIEPALLSVGNAEELVPESGQSIAVAQQNTLARLARQIVAQMEMPW